MKAIETHYIGPGNVRGSRIKATDSDNNTVTLSYDSSVDSEPNHKLAAVALCNRMGWHGEMQGGHTKRGMVWVWVNASDANNFSV